MTEDRLKPKSGVQKRTNSRSIRSVWLNHQAQTEKYYCELFILYSLKK